PLRHNSTSASPSGPEPGIPETSAASTPDTSSERLQQTPAYELTFTCKPCKARSAHRISKQGYHKGTVLITCPECKNRHVISDHLKIFSDTSMTIEDLMRDNGELIKKGSLSPDGDLEFWEDGSTTQRTEERESSLPKELNSG
ncbi:hypothetical protein MMC08_000782, partial [Hypocenomyce scalaris]|nr:hypothetical protein [Hypocenomyce scalaris]